MAAVPPVEQLPDANPLPPFEDVYVVGVPEEDGVRVIWYDSFEALRTGAAAWICVTAIAQGFVEAPFAKFPWLIAIYRAPTSVACERTI
jgi:hypothetical protein